jgi:hypothetical protein
MYHAWYMPDGEECLDMYIEEWEVGGNQIS